jgi:DNA-binding MltR family transcriptional regulator
LKQTQATGADGDWVTVPRKHLDELGEFLQQAPAWIDRGQAATVLKTVAVYESVIQQCLEACMRPLSAKMRARLFNGYGPISSFAAKSDIAYAFRILSDADYADLQIIRKVRNEFAHAQDTIGFEKPQIEALVSRMQKPKTKPKWAYDWYFSRLFEMGNNVIDQTARIAGEAGRRAMAPRPPGMSKARKRTKAAGS